MTDLTRDLPAGAEHATRPSATHGRRWLLIALGAVVLATTFYLVRRTQQPHKPGEAGGPSGAHGATASSPAAHVIPVLVAKAAKRDVPVYLDGLGSVLPLQSVTLHTQVEGRLERVFFSEGQSVKRGQLIAQIDARPFAAQLHQMQATLARDRAQLKNAQLNLERYTTLGAQNLVAQQQVDDQRALVAQQSAQVAQDEAQVESSQLQVEYARLVSPLDGVTGVRQVDPGNLVHVNDPQGIVLITQLDPIAVVFTLPEDELPRVAAELARGPLPVDAFARDGTSKLGSGKLALIDNQIDPTTATIKLKARFDNPAHALWPNQFVKARLSLTTLHGVLTVPATAIQRGPQGTFVYVVSDQNTVAIKPVEVTRVEAEFALLEHGISAGDVVVIDGQNQLRPGSKVIPRSADAKADAKAGGGGPGTGSGQRARPRNAGTRP